jgi:hypothetical protein
VRGAQIGAAAAAMDAGGEKSGGLLTPLRVFSGPVFDARAGLWSYLAV